MTFRNRLASMIMTKASAVGPLQYLKTLGQAVWTPRQYEKLADEGFMRNAIAFRCVCLIAQSAANIEWILKQEDEKITNHPVLKLLNMPNPDEGGFAFMEKFYAFAMISGNTYMEAVTALNPDKPEELYILRPDRMKVIPGPNGYPKAWTYSIDESVKKQWDVEDGKTRPILHMKLFHPLNDYYGMAPTEAAAYAIDIHNSGAAFSKALLDNQATPSGALSSDEQLNDDTYKRLKDGLDQNYKGKKNAGKPMLLEGGLKWIPFSYNLRDLDFVESKREAAREIALSFGVPPMLLGIPGDNTYSNYAEANRAFYRQTVLPLVDRTCDELTNFFRYAYPGIELGYDKNDVPALASERSEIWERLKGADWISQDEKRKETGFEEMEDEELGKMVLVGSGKVPLEFIAFEPGGPEPEPETTEEVEDETEEE